MASLFNLSLKLLEDDERLTAMNTISPLLEEITPEQDPLLRDILFALYDNSQKLSEAMRRVLHNEITALMKAEDEIRGSSLDAVDDAISYFANHRNPEKRAAAETLGALYDRVFDGATLTNNTIESARITQFAAEIGSAEIVNAIAVLDIVEDIEELKRSNTEFERLRLERAASKESDTTPLLQPSRRDFHKTMTFLENYLEFRQERGSDLHRDLASKLAEPLKEIMAVARARNTRDENSTTEE